MKYFALAMPTAVFLYVMFFAVKIMDHAGQNMFQIVKGLIQGYCF